MPHKFEKQKIKLPEGKDRRKKLSDKDREYIVEFHNSGCSIREIARRYQVSRRLVQFVVFPERQKRNLELREERGGSKLYYDKKKHREYVKQHRQYKKTVLEQENKI